MQSFYRSQDPAETARALEALLDTADVSADYVRLRIDLLGVQREAMRALSARSSGETTPVKPDQAPPVRPETLPFVPEVAAKLLDEEIDACRRHGREAPELRRIAVSAAAQPAMIEELVRDVALASDPGRLAQWSRSTGTSGELLLFLARLTAAPFVVDAGRRLGVLLDDLPVSGGFCPVCGSAPALASLCAEDGGRSLHCSLCGWSWRSPRLLCPFCGDEAPAGRQRLFVEGDSARWIETCGACGHYLKTADLRQSKDAGPFSPLVEEVATLYLDVLAEREGCAAGPPYAAPA